MKILAILLGIAASAASSCFAEQFNGRLESIGLDTITIVHAEMGKLTFQVDKEIRRQAAPFLGQWVVVESDRCPKAQAKEMQMPKQ